MFATLFSSKTSQLKVENDTLYEFPEEEFIPDYRSRLTPSEVVQSKLLTLMPDMPVPVSCMHTIRDTRRPATIKRY